MSQRVPGFSQDEMIAVWKDFVQRNYQRTNFRTTFNQKTRTVYRDKSRLLVLDEYHGDLEVLELQMRPGKARHLGTQEIDVVYQTTPGAAKPSVVQVREGKYKPGSKHTFELVGSL